MRTQVSEECPQPRPADSPRDRLLPPLERLVFPGRRSGKSRNLSASTQRWLREPSPTSNPLHHTRGPGWETQEGALVRTQRGRVEEDRLEGGGDREGICSVQMGKAKPRLRRMSPAPGPAIPLPHHLLQKGEPGQHCLPHSRTTWAEAALSGDPRPASSPGKWPWVSLFLSLGSGPLPVKWRWALWLRSHTSSSGLAWCIRGSIYRAEG